MVSRLLRGLTDGWMGASLIVFLERRGSEEQSNGTFAVLTRWIEPLHRASGRPGWRL